MTESEITCPICTHPHQAQIEAQYVQGRMSADDVVTAIGEEHIDILGVLTHFEFHAMAVEKEAEKKERDRRLRELKEQEETERMQETPKTMMIAKKMREALNS